MKKTNKKGFTLVELVIVIAVIAILAAVLIPTFSAVIKKANISSAMQAAKNEFELFIAENAETLKGDEDFYIKSGDYWFKVEDLQFKAEPDNAIANADKGAFKLTKVVSTNKVESSNRDVTAGDFVDSFGKTATTAVITVGGTYYTQANDAAELEGFNKNVEIYAAK